MASKLFKPSEYNTGDALITFAGVFTYLINEAGNDLEKKTEIYGAYMDVVKYISTGINNKPKYISQHEEMVLAFADMAMAGYKNYLNDKKSGKGLTINKIHKAIADINLYGFPVENVSEENQALAKMAYMREGK